MRSSFFVIVIISSAPFPSLASASNSSSSYYGYQELPGSCYVRPGTRINVRFPLTTDYFPLTKPGSTNDTDIAKRAHGICPNGPFPKSLSQNAIASLRLVTTGFIYGVAYWTQLVAYIRANKPGFTIADQSERDYAIEALEVFTAQEEQHALYANNILEYFGVQPLQPCTYKWPAEIKDYNSAINVGELLIANFLGVFEGIVESLSSSGDFELIRWFSSVTQCEAQQVGWFRSVNGKSPSPNPFLTFTSREYLFSYLSNEVIVPNSCPSGYNNLGPMFGPLIIVQPPILCTGVNQIVEFSVESNDIESVSRYSVAYTNQQNLPVVVPIINPRNEGNCVTFFAVFPCSLVTFGLGLTVAVVVNFTGPYKDADELPEYMIFGPALININ